MLVLDTALFIYIFFLSEDVVNFGYNCHNAQERLYNNHIQKFFIVLEHPSPLACYVTAKNDAYNF